MSPPSAPVPVHASSRDRMLASSPVKPGDETSEEDAQQIVATSRTSTNNATTSIGNAQSATPTATTSPLDAFAMNPSSLFMGGGMYGGAGMGMYGSYGMYNPMMGAMGMGPLNSLNQLLFSVQTVVFSLGQAVQIIGMNTQAIKQLFESITAMFDHAVATIQEMQALERARVVTAEEKRRQRRLRALRWTLATAVSYAAFRVVRRWTNSRRQQQRILQPRGMSFTPAGLHGYDSGMGGAGLPYSSYGHQGMNPYGSSALSPYRSSTYGAPAYGGSSGYGGYNSAGPYY